MKGMSSTMNKYENNDIIMLKCTEDLSSYSVYNMDTVEQLLDAARYDEIDVLKELISSGVDVNSQDSFGTTALHNASANGNLECVKLLIANGCKFLKNDSGNTPLHRAVLLQHMDVVTELLKNFKNIDVLEVKNRFGKSAVDIAFDMGNEDLINVLLSHDSAKILEEKVNVEGAEP